MAILMKIPLFAVKEVYARFQERFGNPIQKATIGNYSIDVDIREGIQRRLYTGWYELEETEIFKNLLSPGMVFIDVGASVGYYSFIASSIVGENGTVYSFEPSKYSYDIFKENICGNNIKNIYPQNVGLGDKECKLELFDSIGTESNTENIHAPTFVSQTQPVDNRSMGFVPVIRLDDFCDRIGIKKINLIKIDVEGFEYNVLLGMTRLFESNAVDAVMIEYMQMPPLFTDGTDSQRMDSMLNGYGFEQVASKRYDFGGGLVMGNFFYKNRCRGDL